MVPANTRHKFSTGPDGHGGVHIHANPRFYHGVAGIGAFYRLGS